MLYSLCREKEIKGRLSKAGEIDPQLYNFLIEKIEFGKYLRYKKIVTQLVRKIIAMGTRSYLNSLSWRGIINKINIPSHKKKILFVTGLTFNSVGISIYLRKTGEFETILLTENPWLVGFFRQYFDAVYVYNSYFDVIRILMLSKPYKVHIHGSHNYYFLGVLACCFNSAGTIAGFIDPPSFEPSADNPEELRKKPKDTQMDCFSEEFIFKEADGIVLTMNTLVAGEKLRLRYHSKVPVLEFPTYVCDEFFEEEEKYSQRDGRTYLVYGGIVAPSHQPKEIYGAAQFIDLAKNFIRQGLCFHMYLSPHFSPIQIDTLYSDYIQLAAESPDFNFQYGIPLDRATKEFSKYDFAVMIHITKGTKMNAFHFNTCIPTKFFTYLSAGLPVIINKEFAYIVSVVRKYEIGIVVDQDEIDSLAEIIKSYDYEKLKANVKRARDEFSMKKHIGRLIEFYGQRDGNFS
ncbi:MAG: hypothetical protein CV087_01645 [Candidatus Brocadia sp. WS118]|nr:MAG: hypothetical protein CV087_01645 [Candidatus Brocadia sp. WS118]